MVLSLLLVAVPCSGTGVLFFVLYSSFLSTQYLDMTVMASQWSQFTD